MSLGEGKRDTARRLRERRRELRARMSAAGLRRWRLPGITATEILGTERSPASRFGELLDGLGPLYAAFREYLSLRADLLPLPDCHDLAQSSIQPPPISRERAMELLRRELGDEADPVILTLSEPQRANWLFQWYSAELADGTAVTIKLLRPELESQFTREANLIPVLADIQLVARDGSPTDMGSAADGFLHYLARRLDLAAETRELQQIGESVREFDNFTIARVHPRLCSSRVVSVETLAGARPLAEAPSAEGDNDLGRHLSLLWLQQALLGGLYPDAPLEDEIALLPDHGFAVTGGRFARLERRLRRDLLRYLTASARDEMDRACELLLDQCDAGRGATARFRMQRLFRLAEPFRAGGWSQHIVGQHLSDTLFVQWRMTHTNGYRFKLPLQGLARGLYDLDRHCRRLSPERDGLRRGLDDVRVISAAVRLREYLGPGNLQENLYQLIQSGSLLLRRAADIRHRQVLDEKNEHRSGSHRRDLPSVALGLLVVVACLSLIGGRLMPGGPGDSGEALAAMLYTLVALAFFWQIGRRDNN